MLAPEAHVWEKALRKKIRGTLKELDFSTFLVDDYEALETFYKEANEILGRAKKAAPNVGGLSVYHSSPQKACKSLQVSKKTISIP